MEILSFCLTKGHASSSTLILNEDLLQILHTATWRRLSRINLPHFLVLLRALCINLIHFVSNSIEGSCRIHIVILLLLSELH